MRTHRVPDHFQAVPVCLDGVNRLIGDLVEVNSRDVLQIVVLAIKFVVIESPIIQDGELLLQEIENLGIGAIESGSVVIQDDASVPLIPQIPFGMLFHGSRVTLGTIQIPARRPLDLM